MFFIKLILSSLIKFLLSLINLYYVIYFSTYLHTLYTPTTQYTSSTNTSHIELIINTHETALQIMYEQSNYSQTNLFSQYTQNMSQSSRKSFSFHLLLPKQKIPYIINSAFLHTFKFKLNVFLLMIDSLFHKILCVAQFLLIHRTQISVHACMHLCHIIR